MRTASDRRVDPLDLRPEDITIEDVAHALARLVRYGGHCAGFLSVARHSIWVSQRLQNSGAELALWGLLHDAAEAYVGDQISPLKHHSDFGKAFRAAESLVERCVAERFVLEYPMPLEVHEADRFVSVELEGELGFRDWDATTVAQDQQEFLERYWALSDELEQL